MASSKGIDGVELKRLTTHTDERGFFREVVRVTDPFFQEGFGQFSHSLMYEGVTKAWHVHKTQVDWWYVSSGVLKVALHDARPGSPTEGQTMEFFLGEHQEAAALRIPPGVLHGCKCINGPANLLYLTSGVYDLEEEGRVAHDDPKVGYDWNKGPEIK